MLADGREGIASALLLFRRLCPIAIYTLAYSMGFHPLLLFAVAQSVPATIAVAASGVYVHRAVRNEPAASPLAVVGRSSHYWIAAVATQSRELEVAVVGFAAGANAAGLYGVAIRLAKPVQLMAGSVAQLVVPRVAAGGNVVARRVAHLTTLSACLGVLGVVGLRPAMQYIIPKVLGEEYAAATNPIWLLLMAAIPAALAIPMSSILQGQGREKFVTLVSISTALVGLLAVLLGASRYGVVGAAAGVCAVYSFKLAILGLKVFHPGPPATTADDEVSP